jgi:hypothetical protein
MNNMTPERWKDMLIRALITTDMEHIYDSPYGRATLLNYLYDGIEGYSSYTIEELETMLVYGREALTISV